MTYRIELIWNREFNWVPYNLQSDLSTLDQAVEFAKEIRDQGDGARVKSVRVVNTETGKIEWTG